MLLLHTVLKKNAIFVIRYNPFDK